MAGPTKGEKPSELWRKLSERPRPTATIAFPAKGPDGEPLGHVALWVLTETELHKCRADAETTAKAMLNGETRVGDLGYEDIYRNEMFVQLVTIACRDPDDPQFPAFPSAKQVRGVLTTDELAVLAEGYAEHRRTSGPMLAEMTPNEMEAWLRVLSEGGSSFPLVSMSGAALRDLTMFLVDRIKELSTVIGSAGSPLAAHSSETPTKASDLIDPSDVAGPADVD